MLTYTLDLPILTATRGETSAPETIAGRIAAQPADRRLTYLDDDMRPAHITLPELSDLADRAAAALHGHYGVGRGDRVCVLGRTTPRLITALLGVWRAGAAVTVLPVARRVDPATQLADLARRVTAAQARIVLTDAETAAEVGVGLPAQVVSFDELAARPGAAVPPPPEPDDIALLQFTSGTTSAPKGVAVRHDQIVANSRAMLERGGMIPGDTYVTWLPLYHDMGIITLSGALAYGMNVVAMATETFIGRPGAWLEAISTYRGALTSAPNFAYGLAAFYLSIGRGDFDLSSLRCAINGAEPIDPVALDNFTKAAVEHGMPATAACPGYGLAEATLAVTMTSVDEPHRTITIDRTALEHGTAAPVPEGNPGRAVVSCGRPIPGTQVVITDDAGVSLADGQVGMIRVQGPGVVPAYWTPDGSPHPQAVRDQDGRLVTGDLGFLHEGRLYVTGRQKDMIIVAGRNIYPEDYEFATERLPGVRLGNVIAFALPENEQMVVVAETKFRDDAADELARTVLDSLTRDLSHAPHEVVLVKPGALPKTTSGKRQRHVCRDLYRQGSLPIRARTE